MLPRMVAHRKLGYPGPCHAGQGRLEGSPAVEVAGEAVQIHGGYGYTKEFDVERYFRDAKVTTIYEGTTEIQKELISRHLKE